MYFCNRNYKDTAMRKVLWIIAAGMLAFSCTEKDLYNGPDASLDLTKTFSLRTEKDLSVTALDVEGNPREKVWFRIYPQSPYVNGENTYDVEPLFVGATDEKGILNARLEVPADLTALYVVPGTSAVGQMQTVAVSDQMSLTFDGSASFAGQTKALTRAVTDLKDFDRVQQGVQVGNGLFNLFAPYAPEEFYENPDVSNWRQTQFDISDSRPEGSLASREEISSLFDNLVQSWYPERCNIKDETLLESNPDLWISSENGANVWVTYLGDYGFDQMHHVLGYYNYKKGETLTFDSFKGISGKRITVLFANTDAKNLKQGTKVQLLYWDGKEYKKDFPKDECIGFVFFRQGFVFGKGGPLYPASYAGIKADQVRSDKRVANAYFTTPTANRTGKSQGIMRRSEAYGCTVLGMDGRFLDDPNPHNDKDFNDVVVKIVSNPIKGSEPMTEIPTDTEIIPTQYQYGTLAFEDQWPKEGDYDFNDLVVKYEYGIQKSYDNKVQGVRLSFTPVALGAVRKIGFGIQLPVSAANVDSQLLEDGNSLATVILFRNAREPFGHAAGYVNTESGSPLIEGKTYTVMLPFREAVDWGNNKEFKDFNPFIFVDDRSHEIHLVDKKPTDKMNRQLLGTEEDRSQEGVCYFRMDNSYPWGLDIPRKTAASHTWRYPVERTTVSAVYKRYLDWTTNWYDASVSGNVTDMNLLY